MMKQRLHSRTHFKKYKLLFTDLNIIKPILDALNEEGYTRPTPIQQVAIPHVMAQKDLLGCAQTGTGKTAAFAIPMLQLLAKPKVMASSGVRPIRALILTPTRELAIQIQESFNAWPPPAFKKPCDIWWRKPRPSGRCA